MTPVLRIKKKIPGGPNIKFFMKIGMELPFTLNKKHANTNVKFNFLKVPFWTPEKVRFWFYKTTPQNIFLCVWALIQL